MQSGSVVLGASNVLVGGAGVWITDGEILAPSFGVAISQRTGASILLWAPISSYLKSGCPKQNRSQVVLSSATLEIAFRTNGLENRPDSRADETPEYNNERIAEKI